MSLFDEFQALCWFVQDVHMLVYTYLYIHIQISKCVICVIYMCIYNGKSPLLVRKSTINRPDLIAMLVYRRVSMCIYIYTVFIHVPTVDA